MKSLVMSFHDTFSNKLTYCTCKLENVHLSNIYNYKYIGKINLKKLLCKTFGIKDINKKLNNK